jgi:DNA helicase-2/ATP-dependent DNA helicase PcrA
MDLSHLNTAQKEAVVETEGPVMILAGAGSGKTRTLVSRIQYLLDVKKVSPFRVLAVTFSNKAAKEMRERIASENKIDFGAIQITTFHSFCARVLRNEAQYLGLSRNFTIYDTSESKSIVKAILGKRGVSQKEVHPNEVLAYIDGLKNSGYYIGCRDEEALSDIDQDDIFYKFFQEYEGELHKSNAVDFGGLITGILNLLENFPEVVDRYQKRFHYILVDEYQDTNRAQFRLVKLLSYAKKNICVVGDEDQSIYSWRGADIRNILDFEKIFPDARLIKLEQNYRSSKNIIEAASCVISKNLNRKGKQMWTDNDRGESIRIIECPDDKSEAEFTSLEVDKLIKSGVDPKEIAIFYRTNGQSRLIEDSLRRINIPYKVVAGMKFYERKEIKDLLSYIRCVVNDKDSLALSRVINVPIRGIGARTLRKLEDEAIKMDLSLWDALNLIIDNYEDYKHLKLSAKVKSGLGTFLSVVHEAKVLEQNGEDPALIYEKILNESGYRESLEIEKTYEAQGRLENLDELFTAIKQYQDDEEKPSLVGFLETITLDTSTKEGEDQSEVSMMTIHGSKGLEYYYVFVVGVEETVFPSFQSMEEGEEGMEEERRLFYVAMTRAMKRLYMSFAHGRMLWGSLRFNPPSRFLDEIPEEFYTWASFKKGASAPKKAIRKKQNMDFDCSDEFSQVNDFEGQGEVTFVSSTPKIEFTYSVGTLVRHKLYGDGKILETDGIGKDEKVVIMFKEGTRKKFLVKFAPLEKI